MNANWQYSTETPAAASLQPVALRHCQPRVAKYISPRLAQTTSCRAQRNAGSSVLYTCPDTPATHRHSANAHTAAALRIVCATAAARVTLLSAVRHGPTRLEGCSRAGNNRRPVAWKERDRGAWLARWSWPYDATCPRDKPGRGNRWEPWAAGR